MNERQVDAELYNSEYYVKYNHNYKSFADGKKLIPELETVLSKINFSNKSVLDIGCGRGEVLVYSLTKGAKKAVGIDYSNTAVDISKDTISTSDLPEGKKSAGYVYNMDAKSLNFPDESFDIAVLLDVIEHLYDWELKKCLSEVHRVLKPNGIIVIHTSPNKIPMQFVRFVAGLLNIKLTSDKFHVNEQSIFSLKKNVSGLFAGKITLEKEKHYWLNQMDSRGKVLKAVARITDASIDNFIMHSLLKRFPLNIFFCDSFWFISKPKLSITN
jgi:ubiquinone/menaquinone biosynthesis C-methylase UbiE